MTSIYTHCLTLQGTPAPHALYTYVHRAGLPSVQVSSAKGQAEKRIIPFLTGKLTFEEGRARHDGSSYFRDWLLFSLIYHYECIVLIENMTKIYILSLFALKVCLNLRLLVGSKCYVCVSECRHGWRHEPRPNIHFEHVRSCCYCPHRPIPLAVERDGQELKHDDLHYTVMTDTALW